jgi:hypothetical protein
MVYLMIFSLLFAYVYEDADSLIVRNDSLVICGNHQYNIKVHISQGGKLKVRQWSAAADSFGKLYLNAPTIFIEDLSSVIGSEFGYRGAYLNSHPQGYGPGGGGAGGVSGGAGGGGAYGGNGGSGGDTFGGAGGVAYGDPVDTLIDIGSGGGCGRLSALDGAGGNGGAQIYLRAQHIFIDSSLIVSDGQRGYDGSVEAGGGGAGGGIMFRADTVTLHFTGITANGGNGGDASFGGGGGAGGGRIKIFYTAHLDTLYISTLVQAGAAGSGTYGNPEPGSPGSIHVEQIIGIQEHICGTVKRFSLQSNIIRNHAYVNIPEPPLQLNLYDATGRMIRVFKLTKNTGALYLGDLVQGVYFLKSGPGDYLVEKIVLLK